MSEQPAQGRLTVGQALQRTHELLAELLIDYEHASLALAQQCSGVAAQSPLFSSLFNYRYQGGRSQGSKQKFLLIRLIKV
ncbi:hypothetical protein P4S72_13735 [Vibrio sp. PP-XX7]